MKGNIHYVGHREMRFRHFQNRPYAVFRSLKVQVNIGVLAIASLTFASAGKAQAQTVTTRTHEQETLYELEEVDVRGSRAPLTLGQSARMVTVLDRDAIASAPVQSVSDLLKYAVGVDVRQRGPIGAQTDISVRGGTSEQITILLNGINIGDPQTGHNSADFPVDISDIERIEVLEGPAGRVYGTSSLVGAINIVTKNDTENNADVHLEGGSYGYVSGGGRVNLHSARFNNHVSANYTRSDGYSRNKEGRLNSDYKTVKAFYQGKYTSDDVDLTWHAGVSNKNFGSNTFYSAKFDDQFEHTLKFYTAVQAETKGWLHVQPSVYWNRNHDRFELIRGQETSVKFNYNRTDVLGFNLNNYFETAAGKTAFGAEVRNEDLVSGNLGEPLGRPRPIAGTDREYTLGLNRTNVSFHVEHNLVLPRFTLSAGVIAVKNTWNEMNFRFYPGADFSWQFARNLKLYGSFNTSLRMPSFTELYYSVGGYKADKYLKPEEMSAFEGGLKYLTSGFRSTVSVYHHHGSNMIDWIMDTTQGESAVWESVNHTKVNTLGVEVSTNFDFEVLLPRQRVLRNLSLAYNYISQDKDLEPGLTSMYALEYLRHKVVAQLNLRIIDRLSLGVSYRYHDRVGSYTTVDGKTISYEPYSLLDARLSFDASRYSLYVEANNILNKTYCDYGNVPQPGCWFTAGAKWRIRW